MGCNVGGMRYQPQGPARIGRSWPSLAGAAVFNANARIPSGSKLSPARSITSNGIGATVVLLNEVPVPTGVPVAASWTLLMVLRRDSQATYPYFMGVSGGAYQVAMIGQHDSIGNRMGWFDGSSVLDSGFSQPLGSVDVIGLTFDGTKNRYSWFKNGKAYNSTAGANTGGGTWQFAAVSSVEYTTNTFPLLVIAPRAAPAVDMLALTTNPWQIFEAPEDDEFVAAAGTGPVDTSMSPGAGALTLTGFAPTVVRGVTANVVPGAASLSIAGYAPSVTQGLTKTISPAPASLTLTGYAPAVSQTSAKSVSPAPASLAVTGYAPTVTRGTSQIVQAAAAVPSTLVLTGYAPTISQANNLMPHYADYTIMRFSRLRGVANLGPDRIQQTTGFP